jgi:hypothetical protein
MHRGEVSITISFPFRYRDYIMRGLGDAKLIIAP